MKAMIRFMAVLTCAAALAGCATGKMSPRHAKAAPAPEQNDTGEVRPDRMLIWKASLKIEVGDIQKAMAEATALTERQGGYIEQKTDSESSASLTLRVPARSFKAAVNGLETLGSVTSRNVEGEDVTEQYIDVDARLKNMIALRDRLKQHLEKATAVKDILAIEKELNRVQSDIDSMAGRLKSLKGKVDYATIHLNLGRRSIKGPLGYFFSGLWWGIEKLFVIRE